MTCRQTRAWIPDRAADLARPPERVRRHLAHCPACRREAARDRHWILELATLREAAPVVDVRARVLEGLDAAGKPRRSQGGAAAALTAAALLAAAAAGAGSVFGADAAGVGTLAGAAADVARAAMAALMGLAEAAGVVLQPAGLRLQEALRTLATAEAAARASLAGFMTLISALTLFALLGPNHRGRKDRRPA